MMERSTGMTTDPLPFDPHRFRTAAAHYRAGRTAYPPLLIRRVAERVGVGSAHRVLDLGCGPGPLAIGFSYFAGEVVAIDPEPAMLREAEAAAAGLAPQIVFRRGQFLRSLAGVRPLSPGGHGPRLSLDGSRRDAAPAGCDDRAGRCGGTVRRQPCGCAAERLARALARAHRSLCSRAIRSTSGAA